MKKASEMLKKFLTLVTLTPLFFLTACASTPKVDMKRFLEAQRLLEKMPAAPSCAVIPSTMLKGSLPTDTSGGTFNTLKDVGQQDAAIASHWPILDDRRQTLADTVVLNEETNEKNRADYEDAVQDVKQAFEDVINPPKKSGWKFWK